MKKPASSRIIIDSFCAPFGALLASIMISFMLAPNSASGQMMQNGIVTAWNGSGDFSFNVPSGKGKLVVASSNARVYTLDSPTAPPINAGNNATLLYSIGSPTCANYGSGSLGSHLQTCGSTYSDSSWGLSVVNPQAGTWYFQPAPNFNYPYAIYSWDLLATYYPAPQITAQPQNSAVPIGGTATFTVTAIGSNLQYQWQVGGNNIAGANGSAYTLNNVQLSNQGSYSVVVSSEGGTVTSTAATLTVLTPPSITTQPASVAVVLGATATFTVAAIGSAPLTYQWTKGGGNITGATSATLTIQNVAYANAGTYAVVVTNAAGTQTSSGATLTVLGPPSITAQPQSTGAKSGSTATFTVEATGAPPLSYQWAKGGVNLNGATSATLTIQNVSLSDAGTYDVVVLNSFGTKTSSDATLTVGPAIITQPTNVSVSLGSAASFGVTAVGSPTLTYQWYFNGVALGGQNSATLTIPSVQTADEGTYFVQVANNAAAINSQSVTLLSAPEITVSPQPYSATVGEPVTFAVQALGANPLNYQWNFEPQGGGEYTPIPGANASALTLQGIGLSDAGYFTVTISNLYGSTNSLPVLLMVNPAPKITEEPLGQEISVGQSATLSITALGMLPLYYQWQFDGTNLRGATNSSLTITDAQTVNGGTYQVVVTNDYGITNSTKVLLTVDTPAGSFVTVRKVAGIAITGYIGSGGPVIIPSTIDGLPVVEIATNAFFGLTNITSVTIPNSVISIDDNAFASCTGLTSVTSGSSVTAIGNEAFSGCNTLTGVTIPDSVKVMGEGAFASCTAMASATLGNGITAIGDGAFWDCTALTNITIPNSVSTIGQEVFWGCADMTNITVGAQNSFYSSFNGVLFDKSQATLIECPAGLAGAYTPPNSLRTIADDAFSDCTVLTGVTIPGNVTTIGVNAFAYCSSLANVIIPNSVTNLGDSAFGDCSNLTSVTLGTGITTIGVFAFADCTALAGIVIPNNVTYIGDYSFSDCINLTSVIVGTGVTGIGDLAFFDCTALAGVYFEGNAPTPGSTIFYDDAATVYFNPGTSGWSTTFAGLPTLEFYLTFTITNDTVTITGYTGPGGAVTIPAMIGLPVTAIAPGAFSGQTDLTKVIVPASVTNIGDDAFYGCNAGIYFAGNAPNLGGPNVFGDFGGGVYYVPGTTGWSSTLDGVQTSLWIQYTYTISNGAVTITGYTGSGGAVTIPGIIEGLPVVSIGPNTFYDNTSLTGITIPSSVTNIGNNAFSGCANLTGVNIPGSVITIGAQAFGWCLHLTSAVISNGVTTIGDEAFVQCTSLVGVAIPTSLTNIGFDAFECPMFNSNWTTLIAGNSVSGNYWIPDTVTTIGNAAFENCKLSSVIIPDSVTYIGVSAFGDCYSLTNVAIGDGVTNIDDYAFFDCTNLTSVEIPGSLTAMGDLVFGECSGLTNAIIDNGVSTIGSRAFYSCSALPSVIIPGSVSTIGAAAFDLCWATVYFEGNAPSLGGPGVFSTTVYYLAGTTGWSSTFGGVATALWIQYPSTNGTVTITYTTTNGTVTIIGYKGPGGAVTIPGMIDGQPVVSIGDGAFYGNSSLTSVTIPNSVTTIGDAAFELTALTNVTMPANLTTIGNEAFAYCPLTTVTIPKSVVSIGGAAFEYCILLTSVTIPDGVTTIGGDTFFDCTALTNVNFGISVTSIGEDAFGHCSSLTTLIIPSSVATIGDYAFESCANLTGIYFAGAAPNIDSTAIYSDPGSTLFYLPGTAGWLAAQQTNDIPTAPWVLPQPLILGSGLGFSQQNTGFGFTISWATNLEVTVDACDNLAQAMWTPLATNSLSNGVVYFNDPQWTNHSRRFYQYALHNC